MSRLFTIKGFLPYLSIVFLNAFVDLGHKIIVQNTIFKVYDGQTQIILTAIVNALILLPFIMIFSPAGYCSDRFAKTKVIQASALIAVVLTIAITLFYFLGWFWVAFAMTFLLALQSALYSPAKYGFIKELAGEENLTTANSMVQAVTTVAILSGIFAFSIFFELLLIDSNYSSSSSILSNIWLVGILLVAFSIIELILALKLPKKRLGDANISFDWQQYTRGSYLKNNINIVANNQIILFSIIGLSIFWAISQVVLAAFPAHAKESMDITNTILIQGMMACAGFGIIVGSLLAGRISRDNIETGLIALSSLGIAVCLWLLTFIDTPILLTGIFFIWGIFGGLLLVPFNALIQFHAENNQRGRVLAANNFIQNLAMITFLLLSVLFAIFGIDSVGLFIILSAIAVFTSIYHFYKLPNPTIRFIVAMLFKLKYRINSIGLNRLPKSGGIILLGNHVSWLDWAIVLFACPRPVRFVLLRSIYQIWYLNWLMKCFNVIPISATGSKDAFNQIKTSLNNGDVVCVFPEGSISCTGQLTNFQKGFEKAANNANALIVPFYLQGLWGSRFSRANNKLRQSRKIGWRRNIIIVFGSPLPIDTNTETVKQRLFELSIDAWQFYKADLPTIPVAFINSVKTNINKTVITDSVTGELSGARLLIAVLCFTKLVCQLITTKNIGLLLPTSNAGTIANLAGLMAGKTLVNLNFTASREALQQAVNKANIKTVITSSTFVNKLKRRNINIDDILPDIKLVYMEDLRGEISKSRKLITLLQVRLLPAWLIRTIYCPKITIESPAAILFSSGSEGEPKGVLLSHTNIMANIKQISDLLNPQNSDKVMGILPLFHAFGLTVTTLMPLIEGIPLICHPDPTDSINIGKNVARYQATILCATSTFLRLYTRNNQVHPLMFSSLRIVVAGAEKLSSTVRDSFKIKFNKDIYEGYGTTETSPVASVNIPDALDIRDWAVQQSNKQGSVGMPLPGSSFRIVDPDSLEQLPIGKDGLILIGGCQVMLGYLNDKKKTSQVIVEIDDIRWYKSGDKGHIDSDGFLTLIDRYSRFAKLGGEMISLGAIEEIVRTYLPDIELVAINLPDEKKGEKIILIVEQPCDLTKIQRAMRTDKTNPLMIPTEMIIAEIPKLGSGKTDFTRAKKLLLG